MQEVSRLGVKCLQELIASLQHYNYTDGWPRVATVEAGKQGKTLTGERNASQHQSQPSLGILLSATRELDIMITAHLLLITHTSYFRGT